MKYPRNQYKPYTFFPNMETGRPKNLPSERSAVEVWREYVDGSYYAALLSLDVHLARLERVMEKNRNNSNCFGCGKC